LDQLTFNGWDETWEGQGRERFKKQKMSRRGRSEGHFQRGRGNNLKSEDTIYLANSFTKSAKKNVENEKELGEWRKKTKRRHTKCGVNSIRAVEEICPRGSFERTHEGAHHTWSITTRINPHLKPSKKKGPPGNKGGGLFSPCRKRDTILGGTLPQKIGGKSRKKASI